ncbi:hypothetical protein DPMN_163308 [Dreissena polymorpha]|uniref:Uncharacterized protein n=1 Tax=Dreissena polymorpha TaxID=45954 RepID=A0A9D4IV18_DREPO|nr:hypothetical protein DPMN_163308 [Dreissena polymorpha]
MTSFSCLGVLVWNVLIVGSSIVRIAFTRAEKRAGAQIVVSKVEGLNSHGIIEVVCVYITWMNLSALYSIFGLSTFFIKNEGCYVRYTTIIEDPRLFLI